MSNWDKVIRQAESIPLGGDDLLKIVNGKANIHRYSDLHNINTIDELLGEHGATFILYQHTSDFGHWCAIFKSSFSTSSGGANDNNTLEFFDPYGITLDSELKFSEENQRIHKGNPVKHLTVLVDQSGMKLIQNHVVLQQSLRKVNTCGRHSACRILLRHTDLNTYQKLFKNNNGNADYVVSYLTYLITQK